MNKEYCVYMHTNKTNNKKYIGMTSLEPKIRWAKGNGYKTQPRFYSDILKYGWSGFTHEIIFDGLSKKEAQAKERELIALCETDNIDKGYNINGNKNKKETRIKQVYCVELDRVFKNQSEAARELNLDSSAIGRCCRGERKTSGGYHWSFLDDIEYRIDTINNKLDDLTNKVSLLLESRELDKKSRELDAEIWRYYHNEALKAEAAAND